MLLTDPNAQPYLKSLTSCRNKVVEEGFTEEFQVVGKGLLGVVCGRFYTIDALEMVTCFHFRAKEKRAAAALFILQTKDGIKGTLVDTYEKESEPVTQLLHLCGKRNF